MHISAMADYISNSLRLSFQCWKVIGIWPGKLPSRNYKYYSFLCLFPFLIIYKALLTVNLFYTPLQVNLIIEELMYYFNVLSIVAKVWTIYFHRKEILAICDVLDCDFFKGNDEVGRRIVGKAVRTYKVCWNIHAFLNHFCFFFGSVLAVPLYLLSITNEIEFPVSNYHLFSTETRDHYVAYLYTYQLIGIYMLMMFNLSIDSFIAGLLFYGITQMKVLSHELRSLRWKKENVKTAAQIDKLNYCLRHYESVLSYCARVQDIISVSIFSQIGTSSLTICSVLCAILFPNAKVVYLLSYVTVMILQIFIPCLLGTWLTSESEKLVFAAYDSEWVPQSKSYKSSLKLFIQRANTPVMITGLKMFLLNLDTFVAIMKTAYSFVTLVRSFQESN